jgi:hypothetical protein
LTQPSTLTLTLTQSPTLTLTLTQSPTLTCDRSAVSGLSGAFQVHGC